MIVIFLILSSVAYAPSHPVFVGDDFDEDSDIRFSSSGKGSMEDKMMERFARGELSEDEMRAMSKAKMGDKFSEEEFQKAMVELKERMSRKDTFSYENEGYGQAYYVSPSYEGYSKEHMIFGMIFHYIGDDIDPREIKEFCNEPEKIADSVVGKLKEKLGDLQKVCGQFEENEAKCNEMAKKSCSQLGTALVKGDATETEKIQAVAYACPVNKDAIVQSCKSRNKLHIEQQLRNLDDSCKKRFDFEGERLTKECERFRESNVCDKEKFINRCMGGIKKEDFEESRCNIELCKPYVCCDPSKGTCPLGFPKDCSDCSKDICGADTTTVTLCTADAKQCPDGTYVSRIAPNCEFQQCPTTTCPQITPPLKKEGCTYTPRYDDNKCVVGYDEKCVSTCPSIQKPTCNADETLQTYYDSAGCVTSYQCIRHTTCPQVSKPTCAEGQSLTTKYDEKQCIIGYECVSVTTTNTSTSITGYAVLSTYDDYVRNCENSWVQQQKICSNIPTACDKEVFIEKCKEQERKNYDDFISKIEKNCETQTISEINHAEQRCSKIDEERQRCMEHSMKRCEQMTGLADRCSEFLTEENLRNFIVEEAKKKCKFADIIEDEDDVRDVDEAEIVLAILNTATEEDFDKLELFVNNLKEELKLQDTTVYKGTIEPNRFGDIKLLPFVVNAKLSAVASSERAKEVKEKIVAGQKVQEAASKLASLRDSNVPPEYLYIIENEASDVLDVSEDLEEVEKKEEQKGIGYKIRLFLGLAKAAENEEIKQLGESKEKLSKSIDALTKLIDEVPSDVAKAILKEQVENLKKQQDEIKVLIETKQKKAKGLFGLFG